MINSDPVEAPQAELVAVFDVHMLDYLLDDADALALVQRAHRAGWLRLLRTHLMSDELDRMLNGDRAHKLADLRTIESALTFEEVITASFLSGGNRGGASAADRGDFTPASEEDLALAHTAQHSAVLVTDDRTLAAKASGRGIPAVLPASFVAMLADRLDGSPPVG
jgi:hypothetical protein